MRSVPPPPWLDGVGCGPYALYHALRFYGRRRAPLERIARMAKTGVQGTTEHGLARAAGHLGYTLGHAFRRSPEAARKALEGFLGAGVPALVCQSLDVRWDHWVTVVAVDARGVTFADNQHEGLRTWTWRGFLRKLGARTTLGRRYDLYPLMRSVAVSTGLRRAA